MVEKTENVKTKKESMLNRNNNPSLFYTYLIGFENCLRTIELL